MTNYLQSSDFCSPCQYSDEVLEDLDVPLEGLVSPARRSIPDLRSKLDPPLDYNIFNTRRSNKHSLPTKPALSYIRPIILEPYQPLDYADKNVTQLAVSLGNKTGFADLKSEVSEKTRKPDNDINKTNNCNSGSPPPSQTPILDPLLSSNPPFKQLIQSKLPPSEQPQHNDYKRLASVQLQSKANHPNTYSDYNIKKPILIRSRTKTNDISATTKNTLLHKTTNNSVLPSRKKVSFAQHQVKFYYHHETSSYEISSN